MCSLFTTSSSLLRGELKSGLIDFYGAIVLFVSTSRQYRHISILTLRTSRQPGRYEYRMNQLSNHSPTFGSILVEGPDWPVYRRARLNLGPTGVSGVAIAMYRK